eukprot:COSAG04_NODE_8398_length_980_cov_1.598639_1_plen_129_part_10
MGASHFCMTAVLAPPRVQGCPFGHTSCDANERNPGNFTFGGFVRSFLHPRFGPHCSKFLFPEGAGAGISTPSALADPLLAGVGTAASAYKYVVADYWPAWGLNGDLAIGINSGAPGGSHAGCDQGFTYR